jgi:hypothetical protein
MDFPIFDRRDIMLIRKAFCTLALAVAVLT